MLIYFIGIILSLVAFFNAPASPILQWLSLASFGHFLYGPQMLMALTGAETVPKNSVATSNGFLGWIAYIGKTLLCLITYLCCILCLYLIGRLIYLEELGSYLSLDLKGAASSGLPLSIVVKQYGWNFLLFTLIGCAVLGFILLLPLINLPGYNQKQEQAEAT